MSKESSVFNVNERYVTRGNKLTCRNDKIRYNERRLVGVEGAIHFIERLLNLYTRTS